VFLALLLFSSQNGLKFQCHMRLSIPRSNNCFSSILLPVDTLLSREDHISFFGAAWLFRRSVVSFVFAAKGLMDARCDVDAIVVTWRCSIQSVQFQSSKYVYHKIINQGISLDSVSGVCRLRSFAATRTLNLCMTRDPKNFYMRLLSTSKLDGSPLHFTQLQGVGRLPQSAATMNAIRQTQKLNKQELEEVISPEASWHRDYADTAFIFIGGLPFELSEGDVITIFSQYGEPVFINLVRDKDTGKSKGFCFLKYEDQRSCDLAVDNLGGATVMGRMLNVDHTRYKKRDDEEIYDNTMGERGAAGNGAVEEADDTESEEESRPLLKEEIELAEMMRNEDDDDPMKAYMIKQKQEEVEVARMALAKREKKSKGDKHRRHKSHHSRRHDDSESERRERRRRKHRSRTPDSDHGRHSKHRRRSPSTTPVYSKDEEASRSKHSRRDRSHTPLRRKDSVDRSKARRRTRSPSRTPVYYSDGNDPRTKR
jgi:RNA-binding motif X-linked protein 2